MSDERKIRALGKWAYLKVLPRKGEKSGLILPESQAEKVGYCLAEVISLGSGRYCSKAGRRVPVAGVKEGDTVFLRKYLTDVNPPDTTNPTEFCFVDQEDLVAEIDPKLDISVERI